MQKKLRLGIILAVLAVTIIGAVYWIQSYLLRSRASSNPIATFAIAEGKKVLPGDAFELLVQINPNLKRFYSFDLTFTFDPLKVSPTDTANLVANIAAASSDVNLLTNGTSITIDNASHKGKIRVSGIKNTGSGDPFIGNTPIPLVKIAFTMEASAVLPLEFKWNTSLSKTDLPAPDTLAVENFIYTGIDPTGTTGPTGPPPIGVPSATPKPGAPTLPAPTSTYVQCGADRCQTGFFCYYPPVSDCYEGETCTDMVAVPYCKQKDGKLELTPTPPLGGSGTVGSTTRVDARKDTLYINSIVSYPAPLRYEQTLKLEKGSYTLVVWAKMYVKKGTGLVIVVQCGEQSCGTNAQGKALKMNDVAYRTPTFPLKVEFSELKQSFTVPDSGDSKKYVLRIYCEDGSECELDYVSLEDQWGSERVKNPQFAEVQSMIDPRLQPSSWDVDSTANMYGSIDPAFGVNGALMINNPAK